MKSERGGEEKGTDEGDKVTHVRGEWHKRTKSNKETERKMEEEAEKEVWDNCSPVGLCPCC